MTPRAQRVSYIFDRVAATFFMDREMLLQTRSKEPVRSIRLLAISVTINVLCDDGFNMSSIAAALKCNPSSISVARDVARKRLKTTPWFAGMHELLVEKMRMELEMAAAYPRIFAFGRGLIAGQQPLDRASSTPLSGGDHDSTV